MGYSLFQSSTLGMLSQAHALGTISSNIANVNTGGFKKTVTRFETVLSNSINTSAGGATGVSFKNPDNALGGVKPKDYQIIDSQGVIVATDRSLDLAIVGDGFYQVSPTLQVSSRILYTRDGSFDINVAGATSTGTDANGNTFTIQEGYLADKNGYFLLGIAADPLTGTFTSSSGAQSMRVDPFAFSTQFTATSQAKLGLNLPSLDEFGDSSENFAMQIVDSNGKARTLTFAFSRTATNNQWQMQLSADNLTSNVISPGAAFSLASGAGTGKILAIDPATRKITVKNENVQTAPVPGVFQGLQAGDTITIAGSASNNGTYTIDSVSADFSSITVKTTTPLPGASETITTAATLSSTKQIPNPLIFASNGSLTSPTSMPITLSWDNGATNSFTLDMSTSTQFNGVFTTFSSSQNGLAASVMSGISFDSSGHVIGKFDDGSSRLLYKIPLATFVNANGLEMLSGNLFAESPASGPPRSLFADTSGIASLTPNAVEQSNVDIALEFTNMIQVQQAYNSSATAFRTIDEMTVVARDLKA